MILGIGTDIISVSRVRSALESKQDRFIDRILSNSEKLLIQNADPNTDIAKYIAKRFAAKEAFSKALGLGIGRGVNFNDISVLNDKMGKPVIQLEQKDDFVKLHFNVKDFVAHISLADEGEYAVAYCVIEGN